MKKKSRIKLYQIKLIGHNFKFNKTVIGFKSYSRVCRCYSQVYFLFIVYTCRYAGRGVCSRPIVWPVLMSYLLVSLVSFRVTHRVTHSGLNWLRPVWIQTIPAILVWKWVWIFLKSLIWRKFTLNNVMLWKIMWVKAVLINGSNESMLVGNL